MRKKREPLGAALKARHCWDSSALPARKRHGGVICRFRTGRTLYKLTGMGTDSCSTESGSPRAMTVRNVCPYERQSHKSLHPSRWRRTIQFLKRAFNRTGTESSSVRKQRGSCMKCPALGTAHSEHRVHRNGCITWRDDITMPCKLQVP